MGIQYSSSRDSEYCNLSEDRLSVNNQKPREVKADISYYSNSECSLNEHRISRSIPFAYSRKKGDSS